MKNTKGVTLLELMLVVGLLAIGTLISLWNQRTELEQQQSRNVGVYLAQYNNALRSYLAKHSDTVADIKLGATWLKSTSCGGTLPVGQEYLSCNFPSATASSPIKFGQLSLSTVIEVSGTAPNRRVTATTTTSPFMVGRGMSLQPRSDLSGIAALTATAGMGSAGGGIGVTTDSSFSSNPLDAKITMVASNKADNDIWLRTDGGNKMHANLGFDSTDPSNREIQGVSRLQNFTAQALFLGAPSGISAISGAGVIVDANAEIIGSLKLRNTLTVDNGAQVTGNVNVTQNVTASNVIAGNNVTASNVIAANNVTASDVTAANNVAAGQAISAQVFYDANNTGYYVDPDKTSNLASLATDTVYNRGILESRGRIKAGEFLELQGKANAGFSCAPNGLMGSDASGKPLSCVNGVWKATASPSTWGGSFFYSPGHGGCYVANPLTGGCSCPAEYIQYTAFAIQVGGCFPCTLYQCAKPQ